MEISNRMPKVRQLRAPKSNHKSKEYKHMVNNNALSYRGMENLSHPKYREMERYGTLNVNSRKVIESICNDDAVIIKQDSSSVTALVRYSNRYYVAVMDTDLMVIKTFLPDTIDNYLEYVQQFIDKENSGKMDIAA